MTAPFRNPLLEAEPFQTSQGVDGPSSPTDLQEFYEDMEKRDVERRKSRGKMRRWSRKGSKDGPPADTPNARSSAQDQTQGGANDHEWEVLEKQAARDPPSDDLTHDADDERALSVAEMRHGSIIPPRWSYIPPDDTPIVIAAPTQYRLSYKLHNPIGPRFYRNHHLRPLNSSAIVAAQYPPSAFSSAFPPLAPLPASSPVLGLGHAHLHPHNRPPQFPSPGTSGSSSESALPTPELSQNPFQAPGRDISRIKNNNISGPVGADPVDLMDGSNPWGQQFHHDSPYDLGKKGKGKDEPRNATWGGTSLAPGDQSAGARKRTSVLGGSQAIRKTTPSPLSQSTSAIHIASGEENALPANVGRKLSKTRRTSGGLMGLFGISKSAADPSASRDSSPPVADPPPPATSAPETTNGIAPALQSETDLPATMHTRKLSKSAKPTNASTGSIASVFSPVTGKEGKHTSVIGRMAKRFSLARKTESVVQMGAKRGMFDKGKGKESVVSFTSETEKDIWGNSRRADSDVTLDPSPQKRLQDERKNPDLSKRVPPPPLDKEEKEQPATSVSPPPKDRPPSTQLIPPSFVLPTTQGSPSISIPHVLSPVSVGGSGLGLLEPSQREDPHVRDSVMSLDPQLMWKVGKLTIANPDFGGSETDLSVPGDADARSARLSPTTHGAPQILTTTANSNAPLSNGHAVVGPSKEVSLPPLPSPAEVSSTLASVGDPEPPLPPTPRAPSPELPPPPPLADPLPHKVNIPLVPELPRSKDEHSPLKVEPQPSRVEPPSHKAESPSREDPHPPKAETSLKKDDRPTSSVQPSHSYAASSTTSPLRHKREYAEHEYHIDVPVEGSLFSRTAPGGGSAPPIEKPTLPVLPQKSWSREPSVTTPPRLRTTSKDTTIFTSIFATPSRSRNMSESSPDKTSAQGHTHGFVTSSSISHRRSRGHLRTGSYSPEKPAPAMVYVRAGSESPDKEGRRERTQEKDRDRERRRERRAAERESEREQEDKARRRERRDSSARRRDKEESDRDRERRKEERAREREERERAREKERERDRERGRRREREREREEREREKIREREERERSKEKREQEKEKAREREKERARELEKERARELEKERARELEKERAREREREREKDRERERRKERESRLERETEKYRLVPRKRTGSFTVSSSHNHARSDDTDDADDLVKVSALGRDWEVIDASRTKKRDRDDRHREKARENGYATTSALPHRSSTGVKRESLKPNGNAKQLDTTFGSTSSRTGPRQRAYSLEVPHSRSTSTRPPTPPEKSDEYKTKQQGDKRYSQPPSAPPARLTGSNSYPDPRTTTNPYATQRPTSGFHSSSDLAVFKAKEAWEHDRMWRGQSMAFSADAAGGGTVASTSAPVPARAWGPVSLRDPPVHTQGYAAVNPASYYHQPAPPAHHGSSYTSFMVQPSWSYPQYAQAPPPPPPIEPYSFESSANPLPAPPRESSFDTRTPPRSLHRPVSSEVEAASPADGLRAH